MPKRVAGELADCSIQEWLQEPPGERNGRPGDHDAAVLCGRVAFVEDGARFLLDDGSAALWCRPVAGSPALAAGDFVAVTAAVEGVDGCAARSGGPELSAASVQLLAHPQGQIAGRPSEFPAPSGDWFRLQRDGRRRLRNIERRSQILARIRSFFSHREFTEIEAPLVVPSPGLELHLAAFAVEPSRRYLITSPEYQLKRLLAGGMRRIYSLGKVFRHGELGPHHNPEFTMLEWYRAYAGWSSVATDVVELCAELAVAIHGSPRLRYHGQELDLTPPWPTLSVAEAVHRHTGLRIRGDETAAELRNKVLAAGYPDPPKLALKDGTDRARDEGDNDNDEGGWSWDDVFFSVFLDHVEPALAAAAPGQPVRPVVLADWPAPLCALARRKPGSPEVVERFEAYVAGLELCNGFGELCDVAEQRQRLLHDVAERARRGLPVYPLDERFLAALAEGMPPSGGVALGVDRLLMLLLDAAHIREVLPFTADEL